MEGKIDVVVEIRNENGNPPFVRIDIKDNGPGIEGAMCEKIFDPYFTTKYKSDMHSGTGLGLFIAHQNMVDHGGHIEVSSDLNKGTLFILNLPYTVDRPDFPALWLSRPKAES